MTGGAPLYVTAEMLDDYTGLSSSLRRSWRRVTHPWEFPDRNPFPLIDPVPRYTRAVAWVAEARSRVTGAVMVLRHGRVALAEQAAWDEGWDR